jgi:membrane protein DedA with SNARE-associated domain/membrane-associated phospholipid phosphatase
MGPEWLTSILDWIRVNPELAGLTIALVAFLEGLALVGILIPGIIILFGFGALVGLGVLELGPVWFWCTLGAVLGDGVSFWLGHRYKEHLRDIWPFTRFHNLITRGEDFFRRHGLKSIVIGRFVGPVRPIMPVIAGSMGMKLKRYLPANIIAGILWAPAYLLPGVVFGASIELAKVVAFRLALLLCLLAGLIAVLVWLVKGAYRQLAPRTSSMLAFALQWGHRHPVLGRFTRALVDPRRPESGTLALFAGLLIVTAWGLASLLIAMPFADGTLRVDRAVLTLMSELRNPWADQFMAFLNGLGTVFVLIPAATGVLVWLLWRRRLLAAGHWAGAVGVGILLAAVIGYLLRLVHGSPDLGNNSEALPILHVVLSVVVYGFFAVLISRELPNRRRMWPYLVAATLVSCIGFARLYFGAHWLSDMVAGTLLGVLWVTIIGIAYRRRIRRPFWTTPITGVFFSLIAICAILYSPRFSQAMIDAHTPRVEPSRISAEQWWQQGWSSSLASKPIQGFDERKLNFQYAGELKQLEKLMLENGWKAPPASGWATLLEMLQPEPTPDTLPILPAGYLGRSEALLLHRPGTNPQQQIALHLWSANTLVDGQAPLWVGEVAAHRLQGLLYFFSFWGYTGNNHAAIEQLANDLAGLPQQQINSTLLIQSF